MNESYLQYLTKQYGLPDAAMHVLPYYGFAHDGKLAVKIPNRPVLRVEDIVHKIGGAAQVYFPQIVEDKIQSRRYMLLRAASTSQYTGDIEVAYATKANDYAEVVTLVANSDEALETSSATGVASIKMLFDAGVIEPDRLVVCNGYFIPEYFKQISELVSAGMTNVVAVLDKPEILQYFKEYTGLNFKLGIRQIGKIGANELDNSDSRFGMSFQEALRVAADISEIDHLELVMYQTHLGSQITDESDYLLLAHQHAERYCRLAEQYKTMKFCNFGGGAPIQYGLQPLDFDLGSVVTRLLTYLGTCCSRYNVEQPTIVFEWGRHTVAESKIDICAAITEYSNRHGTFLQLDDTVMGSLPDNWAIGQDFPVLPLSLFGDVVQRYIVGLTCDEDDILHTSRDGKSWKSEVALPKPQRKPTPFDPYYVAIMHSGAYQDNIGPLEHCMQPQEGIWAVTYEAGEWQYKMIQDHQTIADMLTHFRWITN